MESFFVELGRVVALMIVLAAVGWVVFWIAEQ